MRRWLYDVVVALWALVLLGALAGCDTFKDSMTVCGKMCGAAGVRSFTDRSYRDCDKAAAPMQCVCGSPLTDGGTK